MTVSSFALAASSFASFHGWLSVMNLSTAAMPFQAASRAREKFMASYSSSNLAIACPIASRPPPAEIIPHHGQRAASKVAKPVSQIRVHALDQRFVSHFAVLPERHLAQQ